MIAATRRGYSADDNGHTFSWYVSYDNDAPLKTDPPGPNPFVLVKADGQASVAKLTVTMFNDTKRMFDLLDMPRSDDVSAYKGNILNQGEKRYNVNPKVQVVRGGLSVPIQSEWRPPLS